MHELGNSVTRLATATGAGSPFFTGPGPSGGSPGGAPFTMIGLAVSADKSTLYFARLSNGIGPGLDMSVTERLL